MLPADLMRLILRYAMQHRSNRYVRPDGADGPSHQAQTEELDGVLFPVGCFYVQTYACGRGFPRQARPLCPASLRAPVDVRRCVDVRPRATFPTAPGHQGARAAAPPSRECAPPACIFSFFFRHRATAAPNHLLQYKQNTREATHPLIFATPF